MVAWAPLLASSVQRLTVAGYLVSILHPPDRSDQFSTPTLAALQLHDAKNCAGLAASRPWLRFALRPLPGPAGVIGLAF